MRAAEVSPSMIGKHIEVRKPSGTVRGPLRDLATETIEDRALADPEESYTVTRVVLHVGSYWVYMEPGETVHVLH